MMRSSWWLVVFAAACSQPAKGVVHPPSTPAAAESAPPSTFGIVEGRVTDSRTGAGLVGIDVTVSGACQGDGGFGNAYTNQLGRYRIAMPKGECVVEATYGDATTGERTVRIEPSRTLVVDLEIDHDALSAALSKDPPENCPSSKPNEVVIGNEPSQSELDEIVRAVLERDDIPDARTKVVRAEIEHGRTVSPTALPMGFVLQTNADLEAEVKRAHNDVWYVAFYSVYATKTCARVLVGGDFIQARPQTKLCCCIATDFYEKRNGRWHFVKRAHEGCA